MEPDNSVNFQQHPPLPSTTTKITRRHHQSLHRLVYSSQFSHPSLRNTQLSRSRVKDHLIDDLNVEDCFKIDQQAIGCLFCLNFAPSGNLLASTSAASVQIWDVTSRKCVHELKDHTEIVTAYKWFYGETTNVKCMFVTGSLDKTLRVYKDYKNVGILVDHKDWIRCLGLSYDNSCLISGCVSATIVAWDMYTQKPIWRLDNAHSYPSGNDLDTINSLEFCHSNDSLFVSGARDGMIKFWDTRALKKPVVTVQAHNAKLNSVVFSKNDINILTAGRDNTIRLWDIRCLGLGNRLFPTSSTTTTRPTSGVVVEYNKHQCIGYNITAHFYNDEKNIITGSEDKQVYIYDTLHGNITKVISCPPPNHVIHLVAPHPNTLDFVSSSIEDIDILLWSPTRVPYLQKENSISAQESYLQTPHVIAIPQLNPHNHDTHPPNNTNNLNPPVHGNIPIPTEQEMFHVEQEMLLTTHRAAVESLMRKYGDKILQLFHRYNVTFCSLDWNDILSSIGNESDATELMQMVNQMATDFQRAYEYCNTEGNTAEGLESYLASFHTDPISPPKTTTTNGATTAEETTLGVNGTTNTGTINGITTEVPPTIGLRSSEVPMTTTTTTTTTRRVHEIGAFVETASPTFLPLYQTPGHVRPRVPRSMSLGLGGAEVGVGARAGNSGKVRRNPDNKDKQ